MRYRVENNGDGQWLTGVREDLYDGDNDIVLTQPAIFTTREDAERYISDMYGLMHMGGDGVEFRIVEES